MASVNKWIGIGNLGRDPEIRYSADGKAVCNISIACTETWKDKVTGERKEETEWVRVVFYNRLAEIAGEYLRKGRPVYVEGRLRTRKWTGQDGQERFTTEIIAEQMQMLGGRDGGDMGGGSMGGGEYGGGGGGAPAPQRAQRPAPQQQQQQQAPRNNAPMSDNLADMDDDIPF